MQVKWCKKQKNQSVPQPLSNNDILPSPLNYNQNKPQPPQTKYQSLTSPPNHQFKTKSQKYPDRLSKAQVQNQYPPKSKAKNLTKRQYLNKLRKTQPKYSIPIQHKTQTKAHY